MNVILNHEELRAIVRAHMIEKLNIPEKDVGSPDFLHDRGHPVQKNKFHCNTFVNTDNTGHPYRDRGK